MCIYSDKLCYTSIYHIINLASFCHLLTHSCTQLLCVRRLVQIPDSIAEMLKCLSKDRNFPTLDDDGPSTEANTISLFRSIHKHHTSTARVVDVRVIVQLATKYTAIRSNSLAECTITRTYNKCSPAVQTAR